MLTFLNVPRPFIVRPQFCLKANKTLWQPKQDPQGRHRGPAEGGQPLLLGIKAVPQGKACHRRACQDRMPGSNPSADLSLSVHHLIIQSKDRYSA